MPGVRFDRLLYGARASILQGMKNREFKTKFWRDAAATLPTRHKLLLQRAERWELALDDVFEVLSRAKTALFHTPRSAH